MIIFWTYQCHGTNLQKLHADLQHVRWKLKSHYAKKLLAVCGMMTFDPKYSFESPFANIWGNILFDSDNLSFDLIKKRFQIL